MSCCWLRVSPSLVSGVGIVNNLEVNKFEQFMNRIISNINESSVDIFTPEELNKLQKIFKLEEGDITLAIKTTQYLLKRMMKFVLKPPSLQKDLSDLGLNKEKADLLIKVWSADTKNALKELVTDSRGRDHDLVNIKWVLSTQLSSDIAKKCKVPKASITLSGRDAASESKMELSHEELYGLFLQLEGVQTELDNLM